MRAMVLLIATIGVVLPLTARAAPALPNDRAAAVSSPNFVLVDRRCGPGARWVRSGYARGKWRPGHCSRW